MNQKQIESALSIVLEAAARLREARRVSRKVYGDEREIDFHAAIAMGNLTTALEILRGGYAIAKAKN